MSDVILFPNQDDGRKSVYDFPDGSRVTIEAGDQGPLTVAHAVYLVAQIQHNILTGMMKKP